MKFRPMLSLAVAALAASTACHQPANKPDDIATALASFLADHGDLCLGKVSWPIVVTAQDSAVHTSDAVQMPVLEHLGIVTGTALTVQTAEADPTPQAAVSYQLTPLGQRSYLSHRSSAGGAAAVGDLYAGKISLDQIVKVERSPDKTTVHYTYRFAPQAWLQAPEAQQVFPLVAQLHAGQGQRQLAQSFTQRDRRWIPLDPRN